MRKIDTTIKDGKWLQVGTGDDMFEILYRPVPFSALSAIPTNDNIASIIFLFNTCVIGWRGLYGDEDKEIEYNDNNKQQVVEYNTQLLLEIVDVINSHINTTNEIKKN